MANREVTRIRALIASDPDKAREEIAIAYTRARASKADAARLLGVAQNTFWRYVKQLKIEERLQAIHDQAMREGWHHGRTNQFVTRTPIKQPPA